MDVTAVGAALGTPRNGAHPPVKGMAPFLRPQPLLSHEGKASTGPVEHANAFVIAISAGVSRRVYHLWRSLYPALGKGSA